MCLVIDKNETRILKQLLVNQNKQKPVIFYKVLRYQIVYRNYGDLDVLYCGPYQTNYVYQEGVNKARDYIPIKSHNMFVYNGIHVYRSYQTAKKSLRKNQIIVRVHVTSKDLIAANKKEAVFKQINIPSKKDLYEHTHKILYLYDMLRQQVKNNALIKNR